MSVSHLDRALRILLTRPIRRTNNMQSITCLPNPNLKRPLGNNPILLHHIPNTQVLPRNPHLNLLLLARPQLLRLLKVSQLDDGRVIVDPLRELHVGLHGCLARIRRPRVGHLYRKRVRDVVKRGVAAFAAARARAGLLFLAIALGIGVLLLLAVLDGLLCFVGPEPGVEVARDLEEALRGNRLLRVRDRAGVIQCGTLLWPRGRETGELRDAGNAWLREGEVGVAQAVAEGVAGFDACLVEVAVVNVPA